MKVYYPRNPQEASVEVATPEEFVSFYSRVYAFRNRKGFADEERVVEILERGIQSPEDVAAVMRWKTGGRWTTDNEGVFQAIRGGDPSTLEGARALAKSLTAFPHIGAVHAIAFLYTASGARWPIYDRFAHEGLIAIRWELEPDYGVQGVGEAGGARRNQFGAYRKKWFEQYVRSFASYLATDVEGVDAAQPEGKNAELLRYLADNYAKSRDADRALWAYGHLFS